MELIDWDSYDCVHDARLLRRLSRTRSHIQGLGIENSIKNWMESLGSKNKMDNMASMDSDYREYLCQISRVQDLKSSMVKGDDDENDGDEDEMDPQYMIFLKKVRKDVKSYVLEMDENGVCATLKYEAEDMLDDECDPHTRRKVRSLVKGNKIEIPSHVESPKHAEILPASRRENQAKKILKSLHVNPVSRRINGLSHKKFSFGNSHRSDVRCRNDEKNNAVEDSCGLLLNNNEDKLCTQRKRRSILKGEKTEITKDLGNVLRKEYLENSQRVGSAQKKDMNNVVIEKFSKCQLVDPVSCGIKGYSGQNCCYVDNHTSHSQCRNNGENYMVDDSYALFLNNTKPEGDSIIFETAEDVVIYEGEKFPDPEVSMMENAEFCNDGICNPSVTSFVFYDSMEGDDLKCIGSPSSNGHSHFRERLMTILKKPYDQKEYEELLNLVNDRKPVVYHVELRGRYVAYSSDKMGKSYLDWHQDLDQKIRKVKNDQCKVLNLLRGFFFWLKNKCHNGAFLPWLDPLCLSMLPGSE